MPQKIQVMAFRKRLKSFGYSDISIKFNKKEGCYFVSAIEPLASTMIETKLCIVDMNSMFRR